MRFLRLHSIRNKSRTNESGNALIYVLIAIALFAALSFTLSKQTSNQEPSTLREEENRLAVTRLLSYAGQVENAIQQMDFTGSTIAELDFTLPGQVGFDTAPHIHKVFHPSGGGITRGQIDTKLIDSSAATPPAAWYLGRFNNVEWTESTGTDVILAAFHLSEEACSILNEALIGSTTIPNLASVDLVDVLIDAQFHSGANEDFLITHCPTCEEYQAMCVADSSGANFTFYSIVASR